MVDLYARHQLIDIPMGPEVETGEKLKDKMEASTSKAIGISDKELDYKLMKYTTNSEDKKVGGQLVEQTQKIHNDADVEVNIIECSKSGGTELFEAECLDTTECSSSFDGSDYEVEGVDTLGDSEALSDFHGNAASARGFDGFGKLFSKGKKLTSHWRSFIHPLMWRCKWIELQIKKLEAQAQKYDRKLQEYSQKKQAQLEKSALEGLGIKSLTFAENYVRSEVHRRKKRRRAEATEDVAAYMSHHNLFSYYENMKYIREVAYHVLKNPAIAPQEVNIDDQSWNKDDLSCIEAGNGDNFLEQERILREIELLHSQVGKLKSRIGKVMSENAGKFSCTNNLSLPIPHNALTSSPTNTAAPPSTGYRMPVRIYIESQLMSEYNLGGVLLPESAVASHGEVVPDANGSRNHACGNEDDEVLIDNRRVREEMRYFEKVKIHSIQRPLVLKDVLGNTNPPVPAEPDLLMDDQSPPEIRSISNLTAAPKSKNKKRGRRKGAAR